MEALLYKCSCASLVQANLLRQAHVRDKSNKQASNGHANKDSGKPDIAKALAVGLRMLADEVEGQPELLSRAADLMSMDFMNSRAPPAEVTSLTSTLRTLPLQL